MRLLLVDDDEDAVLSMAALLTLRGHVVATAQHAGQAREAVHTFAPDAIVLDITLPGMDGHALCHELRHGTATTARCIVALTGWGSLDQSDAPCFDAHLIKPIHPDELIDTLTALLERGS
jgi:DNA-binding response OmpR family regulator